MKKVKMMIKCILYTKHSTTYLKYQPLYNLKTISLVSRIKLTIIIRNIHINNKKNTCFNHSSRQVKCKLVNGGEWNEIQRNLPAKFKAMLAFDSPNGLTALQRYCPPSSCVGALIVSVN